jgi:hypothetical protein
MEGFRGGSQGQHRGDWKVWDGLIEDQGIGKELKK